MKNDYFIRINNTWMNRFNINSITCSSLNKEAGPHYIKVAFKDGQIEDFDLKDLATMKSTLYNITNEYTLVDENKVGTPLTESIPYNPVF